MKLKRLSLYLAFFLLVSSLMPIYSDQYPQTEAGMLSYIQVLERRLELCKTQITSLDQILQNLETYKNNLTSYNLSTTILTESEQKRLEEEQLLRKQQELLTQKWETKYQEAMNQLTISGENLKKLEKQIKDAKEEYVRLYKENETLKKKYNFWSWFYRIGMILTAFIGYGLSEFMQNLSVI